MADPMYAATDWLAAYDRLRQHGMAQPETAQISAGGMPDWWWQEQRYRQRQTPGFLSQPQDVEALPFGDIADPVSQLAFVLSPHLLAGLKALGTQVAQPGPSLGLRGLGGGQRQRMFLGERGNLGPPPVGPQGEPLPESVVRGRQGELQRLFHGTRSQYPDFEASKFGSGAGGDLYGPGIYMTENPQLAKDYATGMWPDETKHALRSVETAKSMQEYYQAQAASARTLQESQKYLRQAAEVQPLVTRAEQYLAKDVERYPWHFTNEGAGANIRPLYADLKKPFDIGGSFNADEVRRLTGVSPRAAEMPASGWSGEGVYRILEAKLGGKGAANKRLAELGYDGITHMGGAVTGGQPHRVYIAFSPEQVYPSFNVDALRPAGGTR